MLRGGRELAFATGMLLNDVIAVKIPRNGLLKRIINKTQKVKGAIEFEIAESSAPGEMPATLRATATDNGEAGKRIRAMPMCDIRNFAADPSMASMRRQSSWIAAM